MIKTFKIEQFKSIVLLLILFLFVSSINSIFSQTLHSIETNNEVISKLASEACIEIAKEIKKTGADTIKFVIADTPAKDFFYQKIVESSGAQGIRISKNTATVNHAEVKALIEEASIQYLALSGDFDRIIRRGKVRIAATIKYISGEIAVLPTSEMTRQDTVFRFQYEYIESSAYPFAKAALPPEESSLFNQIIEPVVLVSSAMLAVFLFFTVRSN
ncbi:MAG: hypothetical protein QG635_2239 [Bacteroidota bacterium]|nr:hypothetical protein [Bacteroidota bacterium]